MKKLLCACLPLALLSGCATVFTGSSDDVTFKSVPDGAKVEISGVNVGRTPLTVSVKRSLNPPQVQMKLEGYESRQVPMKNSFNVVSIFNVFFWPGFLIDMATGAMMTNDMQAYEVELDPVPGNRQTN